MQLGVNEVLQLSPDEASAKAAKGLVIPGKWPRLEFDDQAIWGECQGSGSKPYQVQVDKAGPAFRCTCPSRKFPCKHGLALLLLMAQKPGSFCRAEAPAWVGEWLASRKERAEKKEHSKAAEAVTATADPEAAAKREAGRLQRMAGGLDDLERWLADCLRQGLAQLVGQANIWEELATRMVDAQLPGLAFRLRRIASRVGKGEDWYARVLGKLGELQLLIEGFRRLETLPGGLQADVRNALGMTLDKGQVQAGGEQVEDEWHVLGQSLEEEDRLWVRRVWLQGGSSRRPAMLLDFAHGARRFDQAYVTGSSIKAILCFFPGNSPLRALVLNTPQLEVKALEPSPIDLAAALDELSKTVAANPWQWPLPLLLGGVVPFPLNGQWNLRTREGHYFPLKLREEDGWLLLAQSV